jgi:Putative addiction module component
MSLVQLQEELKKLSSQEKLALADYLVMQAGETAEPTSTQRAELDRRYADAVAHPERLMEPEEALRRLKR